MIKPGISSSPTDLEGFSLLMALLTSASEMGARDKISEDIIIIVIIIIIIIIIIIKSDNI
jgi:hypothetical protein